MRDLLNKLTIENKKPIVKENTVKKGKKAKTLKNVFEALSTQKPIPVVGKQGSTQQSGAGFLNINDNSPAAQVLSKAVTDLAAQKKLQVVVPTNMQQSNQQNAQQPNQSGQPNQAGATGQAPMGQQQVKEKWGTPTKVAPSEKGKYAGKNKQELTKAYNKLKASGPHKKGSKEYGRMRELAFAIRAKSDWGKVQNENLDIRNHIKEQDITEGYNYEYEVKHDHPTDKNKYAFSIIKAPDIKTARERADKKFKGVIRVDRLKRETVSEVLTKKTPASKVIKDFEKSKAPQFKGKSKEKRKDMALGAYYGMHPEKSKKKVKEADIPSSQGVDTRGAALGSGRNPMTLESKKVNESMNTLDAAYHEGKSHGLSKHNYSCRYDEGTAEHKHYHRGYREGLDECYGMSSVSESHEDHDDQMLDKHFSFDPSSVVHDDDMSHDITDSSDDLPESLFDENAELDEMDKGDWLVHKAKTTPGDTFKAFGQTFHDDEVFESLDKQLKALLEDTQTDTVSEGVSISLSTGHDQTGDVATVTGTDDDAAKVLSLVMKMNLGIADQADQVDQENSSSTEITQVSDYGAPRGNHNDMSGFIKAVSDNQDDYHAEEEHDELDEEDSSCEHCGMESEKCECDDENDNCCNECGMTETECKCDEEKLDEVETDDQRAYQVAEDDDSEEKETSADEESEAEEDNALAKYNKNKAEGSLSEGYIVKNGSKYLKGHPAGGGQMTWVADKAKATVFKSKGEISKAANMRGWSIIPAQQGVDELNEWANKAGPGNTVSDTTFEQDIEFMTKVISGGLNKPKSTGQTTVPVIAHQGERTGIDSLEEWTKLAGVKK